MGYRKPYVPKRRGARSGALRSPKSNHVAEGPLVKAPDLGGLPAIVVNPGESRTPRVRPVWIYDSMVLDESAAIANPDADTVAVLDPRGRFLGSAVYNSTSKIRARIFSLVPQRFDEKYLAEAIRAAVGRRAVLPDVAESCRLIYADSDGLPGIVADRLGPVVSLQLMTRSAVAFTDFIARTVQEHSSCASVVINTDCPPAEGCEVSAGSRWLGDESNPVVVDMDGCKLYADVVHGQKTGLFLDQRFNRKLIRPWCAGSRVLDLFCHVGGWAFSAAAAGAAEVTGIDSSEQALALARRGAELNGFSQVRFEKADVFDYLSDTKTGNAPSPSGSFEVIVCDPPAFAKTRKHVENALKGYLSLNYRCMKLLAPGGILATSSCSNHIAAEEFETMLSVAARNAGMRFQIVARSGQPQDHPILLGCPETDYLKCIVLQRLD